MKTLHPAIHGGLLADTRLPAHLAQLADLGIEPFDLVVVNLYPFRQTVASGASSDECVEQIDIGGPAMVRASAKNHASVAVVTDPAEYPRCSSGPGRGRLHPGASAPRWRPPPSPTPPPTTSRSRPGSNGATPPDDGWPEWTGGAWDKVACAALRREPAPAGRALPAAGGRAWRRAEQLHGKEMSYNNYVDVDAAWRAATDFADPAVAIIKHANPCGIAAMPAATIAAIALAHAGRTPATRCRRSAG